MSDGNNVGTPPPSPGIPGKYKLADYRYGREEMLALNNPNTTEPSEELRKLTTIFVETAQEPISMQSLTEEEQVQTDQEFLNYLSYDLYVYLSMER